MNMLNVSVRKEAEETVSDASTQQPQHQNLTRSYVRSRGPKKSTNSRSAGPLKSVEIYALLSIAFGDHESISDERKSVLEAHKLIMYANKIPVVSEKGRVYIQMLTETSMPELRWCAPNKEQ